MECVCYSLSITTKVFNKKTKITAKIIDQLFLEDKEENLYSSHTIINKAPLFYKNSCEWQKLLRKQ